MNLKDSRCAIALILAVLIVAATGGAVLAQPAAPASGAGTCVRITLASPATARELAAPGVTFTGVLLTVDARALVVKPDRGADPVSVPRTALVRIERSEGRLSRGRYAALGAMLGSGGGAMIGSAAESCKPGELCMRRLAAAVGALIGAAAGGAIGATIPPPERWTAVEPMSLAADADRGDDK